MNSCGPDTFGADPAVVKWQVVRGDSATMRVDFLDDDGVTPYDISTWTFKASSYDPRADVIDVLDVTTGSGYVDITATPETTELWGLGYRQVSANLSFDLEVTIDSQTIWTPIIGNITVLSDVSGSAL